jgi:hypothetical protein
MSLPETDMVGSTQAVARAESLLVRAEHDLLEGRVGAAHQVVTELAAILAEEIELPGLLGRGLWLAALLSLVQGRLDDFDRNSAAAIDSLELAGDTGAAAVARVARLEILDRLAAELAIAELGAAGLLEAQHRYALHAIARTRGELGWDVVNRDRDHLAQLVQALEARGEPAPLGRLIRALGIDSFEAVLISLLIPLCASDELARAAGGDGAASGIPAGVLAALAFDRPLARAAMLERLAPAATLVRRAVVRVHGAGGRPPTAADRLSIDPHVLWFLRTGRIEAGGLPRGVTWHEPTAAPLAAHLLPAAEQVARAIGTTASPLVIVSGDVGAGKVSLVFAAAAIGPRPVMVVDADRLRDSELAALWPEVARDAALSNSVVYLRCERRAPSLAPALAEQQLSVVLGTTPSRAPWLVSEARRVRADVVPVQVATMSTAEQISAWSQALQELGRELIPSSKLAARLCRPELTIGDIVDSATEAVARADAAAVAVDRALLELVLQERFVDRLRGLADVVLPAPAIASGLRPEVVTWIDAVAALIIRGDDGLWGGGENAGGARTRAAMRVSGATEAERLAVVTNLAARLQCPLVRLDTSALLAAPAAMAAAHFGDVVSLAARADALLVLRWHEVPPLHPIRRSLAATAAGRTVMLAICCTSSADDLGALHDLLLANLALEEVG